MLTGKQLIKLFYNKDYDKSYYLGCSLSGRQGINAADKFSDDFDDLVTESSALDFNNLISWRATFSPIIDSSFVNSSNFITPAMWISLIHEEVLRQCDGLDGVIDGIIEDSTQCNFCPETMLCANATSRNCLTSIQVEMVREIFRPFHDAQGELIYPAMQSGSEVLTVRKLYAGQAFSYSEVTIISISIFILLISMLIGLV